MNRARAHTLVAVLVLGCLGGCGSSDGTGGSDEASPAATLSSMLALAEAGDWGAYVDRHYGEAAKFESPSDRDALVARFEEAWGTKILAVLRVAVELEPAVEGDRAVFRKGDTEIFVLHKKDGGGWGFHL